MKQLEQAQSRSIKVDAIILSGGSSQIPVIRQALTELTGGKLPVDIYRPSKAVAYGAARYAQGISRPTDSDTKKRPTAPKITEGNTSMTQHADRSYGLWLPEEGSLKGAVQFLIDTETALPCTSETITVPSSCSDRTRLCLYMSADRAPGEKKGDVDRCKNVRNLFFSLPRDTDCSITLEMDENRCIKVSCRLPDGRVVSKTTFDAITSGKEQ
jgi:molecular chaperone DnaK (HSP70)